VATLPAPEERTKPKPLGVKPETHAAQLIAGRYGTDDTVSIFGAEKTFEYTLRVQGVSAQVLSALYPDVVPPEDAAILAETANLRYVNPNRIREIEAKGGHDIIAINKAWEEVVAQRSQRATAHINKIKTSADSTEPAKALQLRDGLIAVASSVENLRDIVLEKALEWVEFPHMDNTHLYDAVPTVLGRPLVHYAEMLQSGLERIKYFHDNSLVGKWADVTGNYHSAADMGLDGRKIEEELCKRLGLRHMAAPAQIPGREFIEDVYFAIARVAKTNSNLGHFVRWGRSDDVGIFKFPLGKKGSSGMPHKDLKGGNPDKEEQTESMDSVMTGITTAGMIACRMDYARDLTGSALDRIFLETGFKCTDHAVRSLADVVYKLQAVPKRAAERVHRSYGVVTSPRILAYLTDSRRVTEPMPRSEAHDLLGKLATAAYEGRIPFVDVLLQDEKIKSRIPEAEIIRLADPTGYIGESKSIVNAVYDAFHGKKTFDVKAAARPLPAQ
jgi:adenylosuccinate lyase